jgi:ketosteroid isomerase-like protein
MSADVLNRRSGDLVYRFAEVADACDFAGRFVAMEPDCHLVVIVSDGEIVQTREFTSPPAATVAANFAAG